MGARKTTVKVLRKVAFVAATLLVAALFSGFTIWAEAELDPVGFAVLTYYSAPRFPMPEARDWIRLESLAAHSSQHIPEASALADRP